MSPFADRLKTSLGQTVQSYDRTMQDLNEIIALGSAAIRDEAGAIAEFKLSIEREDPTETVFGLWLVDRTGSEGKRTIGYFRIPAKGYPIQVGTIQVGNFLQLHGEEQRVEFHPMHTLSDRSELEKYFGELFSNPDSPVVVFLAYLTRRKKSEATPARRKKTPSPRR